MIDIRLLGSVEIRRSAERANGSAGIEGADAELRAIARQPKRLALLAYLALAPDGAARRRDTLLGLFWPELDDAHARSALRQLVHHLRSALGTEAIVGGPEELALDSSVRCDVAAFERAVRDGRGADAVELYRGELLAGFHAADVAAEFDHWLEGERQRLRDLGAAAAWQVAEARRAARDAIGALHAGRRALTIAPHDEGAVRRLIALCDRLGDRAAAVRAYEEFAARLADELAVEPSAETQALLRAVRERIEPRASGGWMTSSSTGAHPAPLVIDGGAEAAERGHAGAPALAPRATPRSAASHTQSGARRLTRRAIGLSAAAVLVVIALVGLWQARPARAGGWSAARGATPLIAVGDITDYAGASAGGAAGAAALRDMVATNLARAPGLRVVSNARIYELAAQLDRRTARADTGRGVALARAAKAAGARGYVDGSIYRRRDGTLRLDLRVIDLETGNVRGAYEVEGADAFALADRATAQLVSATTRGGADTLHISDVSTRSLVAYKFYEEGLRAFYVDDLRSARRLFGAALAEDSSFVMATYYLARTQELVGAPDSYATLVRAARLAQHAPERERLLITGLLADKSNDPALVPIADSLAARFPYEPDASFLHGLALFHAGDFTGAAHAMERTIALDSTSGSSGGARCRSCDALDLAVEAYQAADSLAAAERLARAAVARQPEGARAWVSLAWSLLLRGHYAEALSSAQRASRLGGHRDDGLLTSIFLEAGQFAVCDSMLAERAADTTALGGALWYMVISERTQGRLRRALTDAVRYRALADRSAGTVSSDQLWSRMAEAQVLLELGRAGTAAALFDSVAALAPPDMPAGFLARHRAWHLTHAAVADAVAGDTTALASHAEEVERVGRASGDVRDRMLHHHVRGLLLLARGESDQAVDEFRHAFVTMRAADNTRLNYDLGRTLLARGQPRDAVYVLRRALHSTVESGALYVSRTELHELLARAYELAGAADSAAAYDRRVAAAWSRGDPEFRARAEAAMRRATLLERHDR